MQIAQTPIGETLDEQTLYEQLLPLDGARIVELGCGAGMHTRNIALGGSKRELHAYEVDKVQHEKNLKADTPHNIVFKYGGAENIDEADASVDVVMMFKSLHHVPLGETANALQEIHRILKPGGLAYISEPVFGGDFNDVLRLFHNEEKVRQHAFEAVRTAVEQGLFVLQQEIFFGAPVHFDDFADLDRKIIQATHTEHRLDDDTYAQVETAFNRHMTAQGANFVAPMRVDLLRKG